MSNTNLHIRHQLIFINLKLEKHYGSNKYKLKRKIMFSYNYFKISEGHNSMLKASRIFLIVTLLYMIVKASMARVQQDNNNDGQVQ